MSEEEAKTYHINPFDVTKVWPHADYPVIEVGELELNRNPENYFAEVGASGVRPEECRSRHGLLAGQDAAGAASSAIRMRTRYRIGVNYNLLPVNEPKCPFSTYNRDGSMRFNANGGGSPNYEPNSFGGPTQEPKYVERPTTYGTSTSAGSATASMTATITRSRGNLFRVMTPEQRKRLIGNIAASLSQTPRHIQERQLEHLYRADPAYGEGVGKALCIPVSELVPAK